MQTNSDDATTQAAELAERILDAVSDAEQDWRLVERCARELAELAASVAPRATGSASRPSPEA